MTLSLPGSYSNSTSFSSSLSKMMEDDDDVPPPPAPGTITPSISRNQPSTSSHLSVPPQPPHHTSDSDEDDIAPPPPVQRVMSYQNKPPPVPNDSDLEDEDEEAPPPPSTAAGGGAPPLPTSVPAMQVIVQQPHTQLAPPPQPPSTTSSTATTTPVAPSTPTPAAPQPALDAALLLSMASMSKTLSSLQTSSSSTPPPNPTTPSEMQNKNGVQQEWNAGGGGNNGKKQSISSSSSSSTQPTRPTSTAPSTPSRTHALPHTTSSPAPQTPSGQHANGDGTTSTQGRTDEFLNGERPYAMPLHRQSTCHTGSNALAGTTPSGTSATNTSGGSSISNSSNKPGVNYNKRSSMIVSPTKGTNASNPYQKQVLSPPTSAQERAAFEANERDLQRMLLVTSDPVRIASPVTGKAPMPSGKPTVTSPTPSTPTVPDKQARRLILEGTLQKKSPGALFTIYQERYFILYSDKLEYFRKKEDSLTGKVAPQGLIPLYSIKFVLNLHQSKGKPCRFDVVVGDSSVGRTFALQTSTQYECENWVEKIKNAIKELESNAANGASAGNGTGSMDFSTMMTPQHRAGGAAGRPSKFWKDTASIEQLLNSPTNANTSGQKTKSPPTISISSHHNSTSGGGPVKSSPTSAGAGGANPSPSSSPQPGDGSAASSTIVTVTSPPIPQILTSLPLKLHLVKTMSRTGGLSIQASSSFSSSVYLTRELGGLNNPEAASFFLIHVIRKDSIAASSSSASTSNDSTTPSSPAQKLLTDMGSTFYTPYFIQQIYRGETADTLFAIYVPAFRISDSLLHFLTLHRRIPEDITKHIGAQLICMLGIIHDCNYIARNLSPDNLYWDGAGVVTFLDCFLTLTPSTGRVAIEDESLVPEYMTPELALGRVEDRTADWWRLGVLLYELSVGIPPFRSGAHTTKLDKQRAIAQILGNHTPGALKFPPFVSANFQSLVRSLLTPDIHERLGGGPAGVEQVKQHPYYEGTDWTAYDLGDADIPSWIAAKVLSTHIDPTVIRNANPHATPDQLSHLLMPSPPKNTYRKPLIRKRALHIKVLGARGLPAESGPGGIQLNLNAAATGETRTLRLSAAQASGSNPSFGTAVQWTLDYSSLGQLAQTQAGEVTITLQSIPVSARASVVASAGGSVTIAVHSLSSIVHVLPGREDQTIDNNELSDLLVWLLDNGDARLHAPTWYSVISEQGLTLGEMQICLAWIELLVPPITPKPKMVKLDKSFASYFGTIEGGEDFSVPLNAASSTSVAAAPAGATLQVPGTTPEANAIAESVSKFATPATRGRTSLFGSLGSKAESDAKVKEQAAAAAAALSAQPEDEFYHPVDLGVPPAAPSAPVQSPAEEEDEESDTDDESSGPPTPANESAAASASATATPKTQARSGLRGLVSKKKLRYQEDGFDLDLSYITPRIIAMGFPSEGTEAVYRNPMDTVQKFFKQKHLNHYRIYNLCSERKYDHAKFGGSVCHIPFNDHGAPAFELFMQFCKDAHLFLAHHKENVVAVHCKAGKGRTGTMIAALLLFEMFSVTSEDALLYFAQKRTKNSKGVTIPSQRRYVAYFAEYLSRYRSTTNSIPRSIPASPSPSAVLMLKHIRLTTVPNFDTNGGCDPYFRVYGPPPGEVKLYDYKETLKEFGLKIQSCHDLSQPHIDLSLPGEGCRVEGDFLIKFLDEDKISSDDKMFHCWLNTSFLADTMYVCLQKNECDKAIKDKKCEKFQQNFQVELWFVHPEPGQLAAAASTTSVDANADANHTGEKDGVLIPVDLGTRSAPVIVGPNAVSPTSPASADDDDDDDDDDEDDGASSSTPASASATPKTATRGGLRGLVSKKKLRYQEDGFDLDLSYITPRIIAMGFPSEGTEAVYRNPMDTVQKFFKQKHSNHYRIYNLCSERKYDHAKFGGSVCHIPFNDHGAPAFELFMQFCKDAHLFLAQHKENVVAVHCKAGKGRTGTMIAALLLFELFSTNAEDALLYFAQKRTKNSKGVTIPSQRRYVSYFADFLSRYRVGESLSSTIPLTPPPVILRLKSIRFHTIPNFDLGGGCDPYFKVKSAPPTEETLYDYRQALKAHGLKVQKCHDKNVKTVEMVVPGGGAAASSSSSSSSSPAYTPGSICDPKQGCIVSGDIKFLFMDEDTMSGDDSMFHVWLNTAFVPQDTLRVVLEKKECDKALKDKKCEKFDAAFKVEFQFEKY